MSTSHKPLAKQALVVFGASSGIGRATARMAVERMDVFSRATAFKLQRSRDPKGPQNDDALFTPPEGDARDRGVVTNTHR